ncbi:MAG: aminomethyl-transferring glycine dehydrogenase subunit GcvPA [Candidatus Eisenbacteria bacterium]|nr:aminomethyl-transferring glycine dehydrogenase subunit GcvPA [Candidatus Eisenbacteria bacterium]
MPYTGYGSQEEKELLRSIGVERFEDLVTALPESLRLKGPVDVPPGQTELELRRLFNEAALANYDPNLTPSFLGGGLYDHDIPAVVQHMQLRSEFYTAYTPYQPEVAQGTLMTIFEFQSMVCDLTGLDVANASMYDAGSAAAEAALLAAAATGRDRILVAGTLHPHHREILKTYGLPPGLRFVDVGGEEPLRPADLAPHIDGETAALVLQQPNFFGSIESIGPLAEAVHAKGALLIVEADPVALALLAPPGELGADIVVGEGQSLGSPPSYGGPACGLFACTRALIRRLPGRLVAETVDRDGRRGFVLTLQTREQHIRREKATSNICTNNNLVALAFTITLAMLGPAGLKEMASLSLQKAHYLERALAAIPGVKRSPGGPFFREFALTLPRPAGEVIDAIYRDARILAGIDLGRLVPGGSNRLLVAVTEKRTRQEMDLFASALERSLA